MCCTPIKSASSDVMLQERSKNLVDTASLSKNSVRRESNTYQNVFSHDFVLVVTYMDVKNKKRRKLICSDRRCGSEQGSDSDGMNKE